MFLTVTADLVYSRIISRKRHNPKRSTSSNYNCNKTLTAVQSESPGRKTVAEFRLNNEWSGDDDGQMKKKFRVFVLAAAPTGQHRCLMGSSGDTSRSSKANQEGAARRLQMLLVCHNRAAQS